MSNGFSDDDFQSDVDFESNPGRTNDRDNWYKGQKGRVDRIAFVYFHPLDQTAIAKAKRHDPSLSDEALRAVAKKTLEDRAKALGKTPDTLTKVDLLDRSVVKFKKMRASFQEGLGFFLNRLGQDGAEADRLWRQVNEPKTYYSTLMLIYPTDRNGKITSDKDEFKRGWKVQPWRLSEMNYEAVGAQNATLAANNLSLASQDFNLKCVDDKYQKMEVTSAGPALWCRKDEFANLVLEEALNWYDKLMPFRVLTSDQLRQKLGLGDAPALGGQIGPAVGSNRQLNGASGGQQPDIDDLLASV
jgi:hypothetical protein